MELIRENYAVDEIGEIKMIDTYSDGALDHRIKRREDGKGNSEIVGFEYWNTAGQRTLWAEKSNNPKLQPMRSVHGGDCDIIMHNFVGKRWDASGNLVFEAHEDGTREWWYSTGQRWIVEQFDGTLESWYPTGELMKSRGSDRVMKEYYKNGGVRLVCFPNGDTIKYYKNGKIECVRQMYGRYKEGWYKNGHRSYVIDYYNQIKKGWRKNGEEFEINMTYTV